jgi:BASS family bile acid:Na+ symporter
MDLFNLSILTATWLMMLAVGLAVNVRDRTPGRSSPALLLSTLIAQWVAMPLCALAIASALRLEPIHAAALLLLAACPVGDIVSYYAVVGRGDVPLAIGLNALSCLAAPLSMGLTFAMLQPARPGEILLSAPTWPLVMRVVLLALVPIALGMLIRARWPAAGLRLLAPCSRVAGACILAVLVWALIRQRNHLALVWSDVLPGVALFLVAGLAIGALWSKTWHLPRPASLAVAVTFPVRNVGLAAAVASSLLGRTEFLTLFALYFLLEVPLFLLGARLWRSLDPSAGPRPSSPT